MPSSTHRLSVILLLLTFAVLVLARLDNVAYWDDEAHVALFAHNFLATHTATAWDGRNLVPDSNGASLNRDLCIDFVQLDNYWVALFLWLFGESDYTGRLAMAVCGIAAMIVFYRLLRLEFPTVPTLRLYALAAAVFSVNLLLYCRNCRYYGLSILLTLLIFLGYRRFLMRRDWPSSALIGVAGALLVFANVLNSISVLGALTVRHLVFHRRTLVRRDWIKVLAAVAIVAAVAIPYFLTCILPAMRMSEKFDPTLHETPAPPWLFARPVIFWWNLQGSNEINALPWVLALTLALFVIRALRAPSPLSERAIAHTALEFAVTFTAFAFFLALATPQNIFRASIPEVRYLTPGLPLLALLVGCALWFIHQRTRLGAGALLALLLTSNLLALTPNAEFRWLLPAWLRETFSPYPTGCSEAINFLERNAQPNDTLWTCPAYMGKPLMLYLGGQMKLRGILGRDTVLCPEGIRRVESLDPALFIDHAYPQWVVAFGKQPTLNPALQLFSRPHLENRQPATFAYRLVKILPICWKQTQRPELVWHSFGPEPRFDPDTEAVYIFKRAKNSVAAPPLSE